MMEHYTRVQLLGQGSGDESDVRFLDITSDGESVQIHLYGANIDDTFWINAATWRQAIGPSIPGASEEEGS